MKYLTLLALLFSTSVFADVPVHITKNTTLMTKTGMIVYDKRQGDYWKIETACNLPIEQNSDVRFVTKARTFKKGTRVIFFIDDNRHTCKVEKVSRFS